MTADVYNNVRCLGHISAMNTTSQLQHYCRSSGVAEGPHDPSLLSVKILSNDAQLFETNHICKDLKLANDLGGHSRSSEIVI